MAQSQHNKKNFLGILIAACMCLVLIVWAKSAYNTLVSLDEQVQTGWSQVENQYQRRADLVPNLLTIVKGYAEHEKETLLAVTQARALATQIKAENIPLDATGIANYQAAQAQLGSAVATLLVVSERYPDLKASDSFRDFQVQLEGTENRISVERKRYNDSVRKYNTELRAFPVSLAAQFFGFDPRLYFNASPNTEVAPTISF